MNNDDRSKIFLRSLPKFTLRSFFLMCVFISLSVYKANDIFVVNAKKGPKKHTIVLQYPDQDFDFELQRGAHSYSLLPGTIKKDENTLNVVTFNEGEILKYDGSEQFTRAQMNNFLFQKSIVDHVHSLGGPYMTDLLFLRLNEFRKLRALVIYGESQFSDQGLEILAELNSLKKITFFRKYASKGYTLTDDSLELIGKMTNLKSLSMTNQIYITDMGIKSLKTLNNLEILILSGFRISDRSMEYIADLRLRELMISNSNITDFGLTHLARLKLLTKLHLASSKKITGRNLGVLKKLTNLIDLNLSGCRLLSNSSLQGLEHAKNLQKLNLSLTGVYDFVLKQLKPMKSLKVLLLSNTRITRLKDIGVKKRLKRLYLNKTPYGSEGLQDLKNFPNLEVLYLDETKVTDTNFHHISSLKHLRILRLRKCKITDESLKHLYGLKKLDSISFSRHPGLTTKGISELKKRLPNLNYQVGP